MRGLGRVVVALTLAAGGVAAADPAATTASGAQQFSGNPTVGALFVPGAYPMLHTCTASVIKTSAGDVVMTAAHCISGTGVGYKFAPGWRNGKAPYGVWDVTAAFGAPGWIDNQNPHRDYAFLTVADRTINGKSRTLQSVTGAHRLGRTATAGDIVKVIGYGLGSKDEALRCTTQVYVHAGYPAFDCDGFVSGTSGSPWLRKTDHGLVVSGDIGGLHQGGCTPQTSYSPPLGKPARAALHSASARGAAHAGSGDVFPVPGSDGCT
jgi:hypothetical protein